MTTTKKEQQSKRYRDIRVGKTQTGKTASQKKLQKNKNRVPKPPVRSVPYTNQYGSSKGSR